MRDKTLMTIRYTLRLRIDALTERLSFWSDSADSMAIRVAESTRAELAEVQAVYDDIVRFQDTGVWPEDMDY
jgi:hypothetical protein